MKLTSQIEYPADGSVLPVQRFVWKPEPTSPKSFGSVGQLAGKRLLVIGGSEGASGQIAASLAKYGAIVARPAAGGGIPDLNGPVDGIIDLNLGIPFAPKDRTAWKEPLRQTVAVLKAVYSDWLGVTDTSRIFYVAVTRMDGQMGYGGGDTLQPLGGIWAGLAKTLPREIPNCNVKILDLCEEDYAQAGEILARELYDWGLFEIGYRGGTRFCLRPQRECVKAAEFTLDSKDVILISGGGRGIGFAIAQKLARTFGCRVVITGRSPAPSADEPWLEMNDDELVAYRNDLLRNSRNRSASAGTGFAGVLKHVAHIGRQIELHRDLKSIESQGLPIQYKVCDFTDANEVRALIESLGPGLSGIIHNAGVDEPKRLSSKSAGSFVEMVSIKVDGFLAILEALNERPLKFLCSVGSLTGRIGGMVGQLDYAAGNEGLARLGLWASGNTPWLVKTLCWPTWERLGMIANYDATLKYMSALNIEEGLDHWQNELVAGGSGEITYIGNFGKALSPIHINGFPVLPGSRQSDRLFSSWFYLGNAVSFRPFSHMRSANRIDARTAPCMAEFFWQGIAAIPISILLEFALSLSDWVTPDTYPDLHLTEIRDVRVRLQNLVITDTCCEFQKEARGVWEDGKWTLHVRMMRRVSSGPDQIAELKLVYGERPKAIRVELYPPAAGVEIPGDGAVAGMRWNGDTFRVAGSFRASDQTLTAYPESCFPEDLWTMTNCPQHTLPSNHLENVIRMALQRRPQPDRAEYLSIAGITFFSGSAECDSIRNSPGSDTWLLLDSQGAAVLSIRGISAATSSVDLEPSVRDAAVPTSYELPVLLLQAATSARGRR